MDQTPTRNFRAPAAEFGLELFCAALEAFRMFNLLNLTMSALSYSPDGTDWGKETSV